MDSLAGWAVDISTTSASITDISDRLRSLEERGTIVYVMRTRSTLDYLFFNYLFLKIGLPLARFANGIDLTFFQGFGHYLKDRWDVSGGGRKLSPRVWTS